MNLKDVKPRVVSNFPIKETPKTSEQKQKKYMKKVLQTMSFKEKEQIFTYNHSLNNKNIPFKHIYKDSVKKPLLKTAPILTGEKAEEKREESPVEEKAQQEKAGSKVK